MRERKNTGSEQLGRKFNFCFT